MPSENTHSFNFNTKLPEYDRKSIYVLDVTVEKYRNVLLALANLLQKIQINYSGQLENTSYAEFSRVLLQNFDENMKTLLDNGSIAKTVIQAVKDSFSV
jgi:hypothetical protein